MTGRCARSSSRHLGPWRLDVEWYTLPWTTTAVGLGAWLAERGIGPDAPPSLTSVVPLAATAAALGVMGAVLGLAARAPLTTRPDA